MTLALTVVVLACQSGNRHVSSQELVVMSLTDSVYGGNEYNNYYMASFTIDVPISGPKALVNSLLVVVNRELYNACEGCAHFDDNVVAFSKKEMFSDDAEFLLNHYMEKYKSIIKDSLWREYGFYLKMEAQTETFVTYGLEYDYCGASCGSEKHYYTFNKHDGHLISEIINHNNLIRFFEDFPEYNSIGADPWSGTSGWKFYPEDEFDNSCFGLLDDHFSLVIAGYGNHFLLIDFPYSKIITYLSSDVQKLVELKCKKDIQ